jgi:signal transduction histidine kinase
MLNSQFHHRLDALFADLDCLAADPESANPRVRRELDALAARLRDLEMRIEESERLGSADPAVPTVKPESQPATLPILYEKERVGYIFAEGSLRPLQEDVPSAANPDKTIVTPLTSSGQTIGNVQIEPSVERAWTPEETSLMAAIAQQASQQIQNLRLLSTTQRARAEAETATRRFMHENWGAYLDAIHHSERIGYAYNQKAVIPYAESTMASDGIRKTLNVMDEQVGTLFVKPDPMRPMTDQDKEMVSVIAHQVAQQVENIRLLADASRARAEAEESTRRLTRENWQAYAAQRGKANSGYIYNSNDVVALGDQQPQLNEEFSQPLTVRGEKIGQLTVAGLKELSSEEAALTAAIAERVSVHLETLRLTEEHQKRAAELQTVAIVSATISSVLNPDELLQTVVDMTKERFGLYHAHIYLTSEPWNVLLLAASAGEIGRQMVRANQTISMDAEASLVAQAVRERTAIISNNIQSEPGYLPNPLLPDTQSEMALPMVVGDKVLGVLDLQSEIIDRFTLEEKSIQTTLATQVGIALHNARLYVEQAATLTQLRELDRLKSSFLANMSHELRTPLNSILGFTDVIIEGLDGPLTENMDNDLHLIQKNGQHLLHLINDVLDMAKIESGRMNLQPERFKVHSVLAEVTSITSTLAIDKRLSLMIDRDSDQELEIYADTTRLRQVIINLVNNSIKFTETGQIILSAKPMDGGRILITVKDTGVGIPLDKLETIFQEFTQVNTSSTRKAGGTGLGLPISRRLVEMHGGRLWAESAGVEGEGSTFYVELPVEARITEVIEKQER